MKKCKIVKNENLLRINSSKILADWFIENKLSSITFKRGHFLELIKLEKDIPMKIDTNYTGYFPYGLISVVRECGVDFFNRKYGFTYYSDFIDTRISQKCYLKKLRLLKLKLTNKLKKILSILIKIIMFQI